MKGDGDLKMIKMLHFTRTFLGVFDRLQVEFRYNFELPLANLLISTNGNILKLIGFNLSRVLGNECFLGKYSNCKAVISFVGIQIINI